MTPDIMPGFKKKKDYHLPPIGDCSVVGAASSSGPLMSQSPSSWSPTLVGSSHFSKSHISESSSWSPTLLTTSHVSVKMSLSPQVSLLSGVTSGISSYSPSFTSVYSSFVCSSLTEYLQLPTTRPSKAKTGRSRVLTTSEA